MNDVQLEWPFADPPNTAVFTNVSILNRIDRVRYVTHDQEDGMWQFHANNAGATVREAALVSLKEVFGIDPTIGQLADLALGWHAWRNADDTRWTRGPNEADLGAV